MMSRKTSKLLSQKVRLDIGGGDSPRDGFLSVDPFHDSDVPVSALNLPFGEGEVEEVYSSHTLEHFNKYEVPKVLSEIFRVLRHDGVFTVEVPDFVYCVREWMKIRNTSFEMDRLFGLQTDKGQEHKIGFTRESLESFIRGAGFQIDSFEYVWSHSQDCFLCRCRKPREG